MKRRPTHPGETWDAAQAVKHDMARIKPLRVA
jgi:hypothetical protein